MTNESDQLDIRPDHPIGTRFYGKGVHGATLENGPIDRVVMPDSNRSDAAIDWQNYQFQNRGILGLLDDMLQRSATFGIRYAWHPGSVTEYSTAGNPTSFTPGFRNAGFRAIMARLAAICHELSAQDVSPYGGAGDFTDPRWPHVRFRVKFSNTPADQHLELTPVFSPEPT